MSERVAVEKLPVRVQRIIESLRSGQTLCRTYRMKETGEGEVLFAFEPSGRSCGPKSAEAAINSGWLAPQADGLFGVDSAQTYIATQA